SQRSGLADARQNELFERIAIGDSDTCLQSRLLTFGSRWTIEVHARIDRDVADVTSVSRYGTIQMPSFAFKRSLTACGLALPPDCFITWPTNQPTSCGLAFACATLSGLAAMMSSTTFSIAPRSVTCFMPRASTSARGSPPSSQTI